MVIHTPFRFLFLLHFIDDRKLKYQTDKLLRLASSTRVSGSGGVTFADEDDDEEDPLSFRPRPEGMAAWGDNTNGEIAGVCVIFFFCFFIRWKFLRACNFFIFFFFFRI